MTDPRLLCWSLVKQEHECSSSENLMPVTPFPAFTEFCPVFLFWIPSFFPSLLASHSRRHHGPNFLPFSRIHILYHMALHFLPATGGVYFSALQLLILGPTEWCENAIMPVLILGLQEALCSHLLFCISALIRHKERSHLSQSYLDEVTPANPRTCKKKKKNGFI